MFADWTEAGLRHEEGVERPLRTSSPVAVVRGWRPPHSCWHGAEDPVAGQVGLGAGVRCGPASLPGGLLCGTAGSGTSACPQAHPGPLTKAGASPTSRSDTASGWEPLPCTPGGWGQLEEPSPPKGPAAQWVPGVSRTLCVTRRPRLCLAPKPQTRTPAGGDGDGAPPRTPAASHRWPASPPCHLCTGTAPHPRA